MWTNCVIASGREPGLYGAVEVVLCEAGSSEHLKDSDHSSNYHVNATEVARHLLRHITTSDRDREREREREVPSENRVWLTSPIGLP